MVVDLRCPWNAWKYLAGHASRTSSVLKRPLPHPDWGERCRGVSGWMGWWVNWWVGWWMSGLIGLVDEWVDKWFCEWMGKWVGGLMSGWMCGLVFAQGIHKLRAWLRDGNDTSWFIDFFNVVQGRMPIVNYYLIINH